MTEGANRQRREEILSVAARLFSEKGFISTTMEDIARELNVTKPALYYYISTKHDLLCEICESAIVRLMEGVREIEARHEDAEQKLRELIRWHVNMFAENGNIINVYLADEGELPPDKRDHFRALSREYESIYRRVLKEGISTGRFREIDVTTAVRALSGMCNWLSAWFSPEGEMSADEIADVFCDIFLNGCRGPGGPTGGGREGGAGR